MLTVKKSRFRVRNAEKIEKSGLLDFILNALIGVITGKRLFSHAIEQVGKKQGRIINFIRLPNQPDLFGDDTPKYWS